MYGSVNYFDRTHLPEDRWVFVYSIDVYAHYHAARNMD
jgi:hypothetical protein